MKKITKGRGIKVASTALLMMVMSHGLSEGWPEYRGAQGNGISNESLTSIWPEPGPRLVWKEAVHSGFSSFVVVNNLAVTLVSREIDGQKREVCLALDASTGKELWTAVLGPAEYDGGGDSGAQGNQGGDGPRSTPAINGGKVFVLDASLSLYALDAETGESKWKRDLITEFEGRNIRWKNAASPVVDGDLLFVYGGGPGQSMIAFNQEDGSVAWKGHDYEMTHATPVVANVQGVRQVIYFTQEGLVSLAVRDGQELWTYPFRYNVSTAASPVVAGDLVYCSAGYGVGAGLVKIMKTGDTLKAEEVWRLPNRLINHWSTPVYHDGFLYGMFGFKKYGEGPLQCVKLKTGEVVWEKDGFGPGNLILVKDRLLALSDKGELVVIEASPTEYREFERMDVIDGKCWSTPALTQSRLFIRSTTEGACLDLTSPTAGL